MHTIQQRKNISQIYLLYQANVIYTLYIRRNTDAEACAASLESQCCI